MNKTRLTLATLVVGAVVSLTAGCGGGNATSADVTGVTAVKPDVIEAYSNIDGYPNIVVLCIHKVAFATTQRNAGQNFVRVPELDVTLCHGTPSPYNLNTPNDGAPRPASS